MRATDILRAIFRSSGPRRDEADAIAAELERERRLNRVAVWKNKRAVRSLLDEAIARTEQRNGSDRTHS